MFIKKMAVPRRTVLRGLGAALALPLLDSMVPALTAVAKTAAAPTRRLATVYFPNGMAMEYWTPAAEGSGFELPVVMKPLEPYRNRLLVVSGLRGPNGGAHAGGADGPEVACWARPHPTPGNAEGGSGRPERLLRQQQLAVAGDPQPIFLVAMLDDDFLAAAQDGVERHPLRRARLGSCRAAPADSPTLLSSGPGP